MRYLVLLLLACGGPPVGGESVDAGEPDAGAPCEGPEQGRRVLSCIEDGGAQLQCYHRRLVVISCGGMPCPPFEYSGRPTEYTCR